MLATYSGIAARARASRRPAPFEQTLELALEGGRFVIVGSRAGRRGAPLTSTVAESRPPLPATSRVAPALAGVQLTDVAAEVGLDFRQGAFRFHDVARPGRDDGRRRCAGSTTTTTAGSTSTSSTPTRSRSTSPRGRSRAACRAARSSATSKGRFVDVSRGSGADLAVRGNGCVAADFNGDGHTDLYVTTAGYDALLWNDGDGTFVEGARAAGHRLVRLAHGRRGRGRERRRTARPVRRRVHGPQRARSRTRSRAFPTNYEGVRDLLFLNQGPDANGRATFREVGMQAGLEAARFEHGLGAVFTDFNGDGRLDLYVANDEDPEPALRERRVAGGGRAGPSGSASGSRSAPRARASPTRTPAWASPLPTTTPTGAPTCS